MHYTLIEKIMDWIWAWVNRPNLQVVGLDNADNIGWLSGPRVGQNSYWIRVKVINRGNALIQNCRARLLDVHPRINHFNSLDLLWVRSGESDQPSAVSLAPNEERTFDLGFVTEHDNIFHVHPANMTAAINSVIHYPKNVDRDFNIIIFSDNRATRLSLNLKRAGTYNESPSLHINSQNRDRGKVKGTSPMKVAIVATVVGAVLSGIFLFANTMFEWVINPANTHTALNAAKLTPATSPALSARSIVKPQIVNGDFEDYFDGWTRIEFGSTVVTSWPAASRDAGRATAPEGVVSIPPPPGVFNIVDRFGNDLSKGLYIKCASKPSAEKYHRLQQDIEGLKPGAIYRVKFWVNRYEGSTIDKESLYFALGTPWTLSNKFFYKEDIKNGFNYIDIKNPSRSKETFFIVINDVATGLVLDSFSIEEVPS